RFRRQCGQSEKAAIDDLVVGLGLAVLAELPDYIYRNMVAPRHMAVEEYAMQHRLALQLDPPFLHQFAPQRVEHGLADFDAAARQVPAGHIAVLDQKDFPLRIDDNGADAEGHAAGETPIEMKQPPQCRLTPSSHILQVHYCYTPRPRTVMGLGL